MNIKDLVGKTITSATKMKEPDYDDTGFLKLEFSDGTSCTIVSGYGSYTRGARDEYPTTISIEQGWAGLVEAPDEKEGSS